MNYPKYLRRIDCSTFSSMLFIICLCKDKKNNLFFGVINRPLLSICQRYPVRLPLGMSKLTPAFVCVWEGSIYGLCFLPPLSCFSSGLAHCCRPSRMKITSFRKSGCLSSPSPWEAPLGQLWDWVFDAKSQYDFEIAYKPQFSPCPAHRHFCADSWS